MECTGFAAAGATANAFAFPAAFREYYARPDLPGASAPRFTAPNRPPEEAKRVRTLRHVFASSFGAKKQTES